MTFFDEIRQKPSKTVNFFPLTLTDGPFVQTANLVDVDGRSIIWEMMVLTVKNRQKPSISLFCFLSKNADIKINYYNIYKKSCIPSAYWPQSYRLNNVYNYIAYHQSTFLY